MQKNYLLSEEKLLNWTGYRRSGDLINWFEQNKIPYCRAKGGRVVTTQSAIDSAFITPENLNDTEGFDFDG